MSNYYDRTENFTFAWKIGDFRQAALEAEKLAESGPSRDRMLYRLEEGSVKRLQNDPSGSIRAFDWAGQHYDKWFGVHLKEQSKLSEELIATIGSPEWKPYKSRVYERVMLRLYQALNYLQIEDEGRARAQIFKIRQAVSDAKEIWKMELDASRELMRRKSVDLDQSIGKQKTSEMEAEIKRIRSMIPANLPEYANPAAIYLEAIYFLHQGNSPDEFERAEFSLRELSALFPENPHIREDYQRAKEKRKPELSSTYVFFETGRAPVRREKRYDLPLIFLSSSSRLPYLGVAFPVLRINDDFLPGLEASYSGKSASTISVADFDAIVAKEYEKDYPIELSRAIAGAMSKGSLQYLATDAVRGKSENIRVSTGAGVGALAQGLTRADWRSWTTLPKQIQFCKIPISASRELTLRGVGTKLIRKIDLKPNKTNLVWIRSISAHTPLRVVNHFAL